MTLQRKNEGFTIVELLIVIVVIGILAALVVTTFTGIQQRARNTERETDIKAIHGQLEAYYAQNGSYPAMSDVNNAGWRSTNMKGLDPEALKDPKGSAQTLATAASSTAYGYAPLSTTDGTCTTVDANCTKYTLTANLEGGTTFTKSSLN
ncbi:MAG TPA: type II secretion system protein [Verrucomicrobiae bacterium]|nr:type II secretion system protein [Verrucomicrobiae bacterium]